MPDGVHPSFPTLDSPSALSDLGLVNSYSGKPFIFKNIYLCLFSLLSLEVSRGKMLAFRIDPPVPSFPPVPTLAFLLCCLHASRQGGDSVGVLAAGLAVHLVGPLHGVSPRRPCASVVSLSRVPSHPRCPICSSCWMLVCFMFWLSPTKPLQAFLYRSSGEWMFSFLSWWGGTLSLLCLTSRASPARVRALLALGTVHVLDCGRCGGCGVTFFSWASCTCSCGLHSSRRRDGAGILKLEERRVHSVCRCPATPTSRPSCLRPGPPSSLQIAV